MESIEGNKIISEFMEMKDSSLGYAIPDSFRCNWTHCEDHDFMFHSSWDWQIPAWSKAITEFKEWATIGDQSQYQEYIRLLEQYENAVFHNKPEVGQGVLVKAITILNTHSSNTKQK